MDRAARRRAERNKSALVVRQKSRSGQQVNMGMVWDLCLDCVEFLRKEYSQYDWEVMPSADGSMIEIKCAATGVSTAHGWQVRTQDIENVTQRRPLLRKLGGEILERFQLARHRKTDISDVTGKRNTLGQLQPQT